MTSRDADTFRRVFEELEAVRTRLGRLEAFEQKRRAYYEERVPLMEAVRENEQELVGTEQQFATIRPRLLQLQEMAKDAEATPEEYAELLSLAEEGLRYMVTAERLKERIKAGQAEVVKLDDAFVAMILQF